MSSLQQRFVAARFALVCGALACGVARAQESAQPAAQASAQSPSPTAPRPVAVAGFTVDLVAQAPEILWPSADCCLDDGSLLVGEDRMDMPGPTNQPLDRIWKLAWNEDGLTYTKTLFCDHLFATFGIEQVDDAVYVMNMPHLTVLRDRDGDGVAEERKELLTDLGPPAPGWPGGFNDHIVSGIRLGMDGFLYIAAGDKGIPLAHGTDGRTLTLRGGGVVRVRPDGSELEIVASGLRNVLDVAIDERGEMFTYDNTDDGLGWWTRLTHIVPGGYYGYPWDYHDHPERMLPCMAEYGGGSPCGGLVYREAMWPLPYRGSLFFCEWGKGILQRFELEPAGSTFRVKKSEEFVTAGDVKDFRPLDLCESPDGRFLYVSDWGYTGWTVPDEAGRLWRVRREDDDGRKPNGLVRRATRLDNSIEQYLSWIALLDSPSFRQRLVAQRALTRMLREELERDGVPSIQSRAIGAHWRDMSPLAKAHGAWVLPAYGSDEVAEEAGLPIQDRDVNVRAQGIAADMGEGSADANWLKDGEPRIQRMIASAIDAHTFANAPAPGFETRELTRILSSSDDPFLRFACRRGIARCRQWASIVDTLRSAQRSVQDELLLAVRDQFDVDCARALADLVCESGASSSDLRARTLRTLSALHRKPTPWDGKWWNIQPAKTKPPAKTVEWEGTSIVVGAVREALADPASEVRRAALESIEEMREVALLPVVRERWAKETDASVRARILDVLAALQDHDSAEMLGGIVRDAAVAPELRARAVRVAAAIGGEAMVALLRDAASQPSAPAEQVVACIEALARLELDSAQGPVRAALRHPDGRVRAASCTAWGAIHRNSPDAAQPELIAALADPSDVVRCAAIRALGKLELASSVPALLAIARAEPASPGAPSTTPNNADAPRVEALLALAKRPDARAKDAFLRGLAERDLAVREASRRALAELRDELRPAFESSARQGTLDPAVLAELQAIYRAPQPVRRWRLLGPFPLDAAPAIEAEPLDFAKSYAVADTGNGESAKSGTASAPIAWVERDADPSTGFVDLERALASRSNVCAFAACEVRSSRARDVELRAGSDDMLSVWVNGERAHVFDGHRAWIEDEDRFTAHLREGANTILLRIGQASGQWSFDLKLPPDESGPLFERAAPSAPTSADYRAFALAHAGDAARGARIFRDASGPMCIRCHAIAGEGEHVGPDLSDVGAKYAREELVTSVLEPSKRIAEGYKAVKVRLIDDEVVFGQIRSEDAREVALVDTSGRLETFDRSEIAEIVTSPLSVMPDGLATLLTPAEFADLIAYLESCRTPGK